LLTKQVEAAPLARRLLDEAVARAPSRTSAAKARASTPSPRAAWAASSAPCWPVATIATRQAAARQLLDDRAADAAAAAGDEGDAPGQVGHARHLRRRAGQGVKARARAAVAQVATADGGSPRLTRFVSWRPGAGSSTLSAQAPEQRGDARVPAHGRGELAAQAARMRAGSSVGSALTLSTTGTRGRADLRSSRAPRTASAAAEAMQGEWKAPATGKRHGLADLVLREQPWRALERVARAGDRRSGWAEQVGDDEHAVARGRRAEGLRRGLVGAARARACRSGARRRPRCMAWPRRRTSRSAARA
jgi:hypothetical protein